MQYTARFGLLLLSLFAIIGCVPKDTKQSTWIKPGYTGKQYEKLAVVCVNEKRKVRKKFRKRIVRALQDKGIQAVSGKDLFPEGLTEADKDPEHFINRLQAVDVDGVLAVFIIREKTMAKKVVDLKGEGVYWVGKFMYRRVIIDKADDNVDDDEEEEDEEDDILEYFMIETVLHDVSKDLQEKKETLVWRGEVEIKKDSTTKVAAQNYADSLAVQLVHIDGVVK